MRTTLDIDDDLLAAVKERARRARSTAGQVVSRLLRHPLTGADAPTPAVRSRLVAVAGFLPFPARAGVVTTNEQLNALREQAVLSPAHDEAFAQRIQRPFATVAVDVLPLPKRRAPRVVRTRAKR